jgi:DNA-binding response OmpR family regulator
MVVDDDHLITMTILLFLRHKGYNVDIFHSGTDAIAYLRMNRPDAILLDLRLPDCDGWLIARLLKKLEWFGHVPVIIMSVLEIDTQMMAEIKPFAFIQKPFDMGFLLQTIEAGFHRINALAKL